MNSINFLADYSFENVAHSGIGWEKGMISTKSLYSLMAKDIITFSVDIKVKNIYDSSCKVIPFQLWSDYIIDCEQQQPHIPLKNGHKHEVKDDANSMLMSMVNQL